MPSTVRLRPVRPDDLPWLEALDASAEADPGGFDWFGFEPHGWLRRRFDHDGLLGEDAGRLLVQLPDGTRVGEVSYHARQYGRSAANRAFNIGVVIAAEHRGRGYGSAAQRLLARYLFAHTLVERVEAATDVDNLAEQRALEAAGFTREGVARRAQFRDGAWHDLVVYSRLRGDQPPG
jgi:RimJ/RimL family protein N-acetyltransferase